MRVILGEFKSCVTDLPEKDGDYIVMRFTSDFKLFSCTEMGYTVKCGWNTHKLTSDDGYSDKHKIEWKEEDGAYWTTSDCEVEK